MRENIYYWKCDSPHSVTEKRQRYFKEKYDSADLAEGVRRACQGVFGAAPQEIAPLRVDGNHTAFIVTHQDKKYFFRADDGTGDDDYMLAESALMRLAAGGGVPVPQVHHTDVSRTVCPFRFQLMDCCPEPCLNLHHRNGKLDLAAVALQLGQYLRRLHAIRMDGFGFVNTDLLSSSGRIQGLDATYPDYFHKRLDEHLAYLRQNSLLADQDIDDVRRQFQRHLPRLQLAHGVLVHRDMAFWNVLGTPDRITAIIDWDDAVSGDPADDLGILRCFYDDPFMDRVMAGYWGAEPVPDDFRCRVWLHTLRNMLWKTMIRHALGYFDKGNDFFLNTPGIKQSLREHTLQIVQNALTQVRSWDNP